MAMGNGAGGFALGERMGDCDILHSVGHGFWDGGIYGSGRSF